MQEFRCNGIWWLPQNPSDKVAGELHFSDEASAHLALAGVFGEPAQRFEEKSVPIILGLAWDCPLGNLVTLRDCRVKGMKIGMPGISREEYFADRLFFGSHLTSEEEFSFSELIIALSGLPSWADDLTGLAQSDAPAGEGHRGGFEIRWLRPEPISGEIPGGHVTLGVGAKLTTVRREWSIREDVRFHIACERPQSDDELSQRYSYPLQNLMTLATDHPNALVEFKVKRPNGRDYIRVLGPRIFHDEDAAADLLRHKMLFSLKDVRSRAVELISKWIDVSQRLKGACNPYFSIHYKPGSFVDTKFLAVFQSLEVYYRERHPEIFPTVPAGVSLQDFLPGLLQEHWDGVGPLFGRTPAEAATEVVQFRNCVVHGYPDLMNKPDYGEKLYWLTQKLMFLMKGCLLRELGFSVEDQLKLFRQNQLHVHLLSLARN